MNKLDEKIGKINRCGVKFVSAEHVVPNGDKITGWTVYLDDKEQSKIHIDMYESIFTLKERAPMIMQRYPFASMLKIFPEKVNVGKERVNTFVELLQDTLSKNETEDKATEFVFRGVKNAKYLLQPSLSRNPKFLLREEDIIASAKFAKPNVFKEEMQPIELLALLQHFGIPTRLLDVTENALVALYFACQPSLNSDGKENDGVVYIFKNEKVGANHSLQNAIADSGRLLDFNDGATPRISLQTFLTTAEAQPYWTRKTSYNVSSDGNSAEKYVIKHINKPQFVSAPAFSVRQQIQQGKYILFPNSIEGVMGRRHFVQKIDAIPFDDESIIGAIKIKATGKKRMLKELKSLGITEKSLFNDDTDKVCRNICMLYE